MEVFVTIEKAKDGSYWCQTETEILGGYLTSTGRTIEEAKENLNECLAEAKEDLERRQMKKGIMMALALTAALTAGAQGTAEDYRRAAELPQKFAASQVSGWVSGVEWKDDSTYTLKYYSDPAPQQERSRRRPERGARRPSRARRSSSATG